MTACDAEPVEERSIKAVLAGKRSCMTHIDFCTACGAAGLDRNDRDFCFQSANGCSRKCMYILNTFDMQTDRGYPRIGDHVVDVLVKGQAAFVTDGDHIGHIQTATLH